MSLDNTNVETQTLNSERLVRILLERRLLTAERLLVAQRHAEEQNIDLSQSLLDLQLMSHPQVEELLADRSTEPESPPPPARQAPSASGRVETVATKRPDGTQVESDVRAELRAIAETAIVPDLLQQIMARSFATRATDIHLDPRQGRYTVRYRIDGQLHDMVDLDSETAHAVIRGIKIAAEMNIMERRHPQDGGMAFQFGDRLRSLRVATVPTTDGEKIVMRNFEPDTMALGLERLGLEPDQIHQVHQFLAQPYGAILVGGPVGSGKTTTLYSCLERLHHPSRNVMSIEDPVEYRFLGVNQVEIDPRINLNFAEGLRAILRQDPDVLMIGEIRDDETAAIGIRASLTGVLVLSSIHASDAAGIIGSLFSYDIPGYSLASSLQGVIAQRLVRKICPHCKTPFQPDPTVLKALKLNPDEHEGQMLYRGEGCATCFHTGYHGRTGVYEVMPISELVRDLIFRQTTKEVIREVARDDGMVTLRVAAITKVLRGETTIEEMYRVTM